MGSSLKTSHSWGFPCALGPLCTLACVSKLLDERSSELFQSVILNVEARSEFILLKINTYGNFQKHGIPTRVPFNP